MARLIVLGIDGMDWLLTGEYLDELENIKSTFSRGYMGRMDSIFPPDSIPSWISIFTGLDPSEHGVLESIDYFKKDAKGFKVNIDTFRGKTFWDAAGELGKDVIVVNPLLAYPPWEVKGIMASGPVFISGEVLTFPEKIKSTFPPPPLGGIVDFPSKNELERFAEKTFSETEQIVDYTIKLMKNNPWDLVFVSLLTLDRISHFFWRFHDREDPTYPGSNRFEEVIKDFYKRIDGYIEMLLDASGKDAVIMVVSDHGHGRRPTLLFNLNQLLMEHGYLESKVKGVKFLNPRYHLERAKNLVLETLHRLDLEDVSYKVAKVLPWTRKMKKGDFITDYSSNLASASKFGGNNPFGGVEISMKLCGQRGIDYEKLRDEIIELLLSVKDKNGKSVFRWAKRREELYNGPFLSNFPDILYEMEPEYGTSWSLFTPIITLNPRHRKISGGHRQGGVMMIGPLDGWMVKEENINPLNIKSSVLKVISDGSYGGEPGRESFIDKH